MRRLIFYISIILMPALTAEGQEVRVAAAFDSSRIYIGDQINFKITVEQPADLSTTIISFKDSLIKNIEILSGPAIDTVRSRDGRITIEHNYLITSFYANSYQLPPVYAEIENEDGIKRFFSDYTFLEVIRTSIAPADDAEIFDIIAPYKAPISAGEILPWLLLAALAGVLAYFAYRLYKKYNTKEVVEEVIKPSDPAHVIAFRELEKLKDEQLWQRGEAKLYYTKLTEILRQYLENRFGVNSLELTTDETLTALLRSGFKKDEDFKSLKNILKGADMVKFAKYNPEAAENEVYFLESWSFVNNTKLVETIAVENNKKGGVQ